MEHTIITKMQKAIKILKRGGVIICPSESCYSLSCDARNKKAIEKIHEIKQEPLNKPLSVAISNLNQIKEFGIVTQETKELSKKIFPAQLNLIIPEKTPNKFSFLSKSGISFRIPKNKTLFELSKALNTPIVTTSANIHGQSEIYKISEIKELFKEKVDLIIDKGDLNSNVPTSTIYDTRTKKIMRQGIVKI